MRNALIRMGAIFLFVGLSAAQAVEELVEATAIAPAEYAVFYTGFCAERVGLKLISVARGGERDVEGLIKKAEASVPHLLKRCPGVEEIVADVRSRRDPTNAAYFTMRRADNWNPKATITSVELRSVLDAAGYRVVAGPRPLYAKAYWRLEKERFELVYGNDLENRMVATHFARQGAGEYRIRGQLYELGYSESGRRCDTSREGYPLWGVFTMEVSADLQALPITIDWCAGVDGAAFRETTELFELPWPGAVSGRQESTPLLLGRALSNASSTINAEPARDGGSRPPLIDREYYRVYATQPDLCTQLQFDVVYRVNHERRDSVFSGSYTRAISNVVGSLVSRRCGSASRFVVNAYEVGDVMEIPVDFAQFGRRRQSVG